MCFLFVCLSPFYREILKRAYYSTFCVFSRLRLRYFLNSDRQAGRNTDGRTDRQAVGAGRQAEWHRPADRDAGRQSGTDQRTETQDDRVGQTSGQRRRQTEWDRPADRDVGRHCGTDQGTETQEDKVVHTADRVALTSRRRRRQADRQRDRQTCRQVDVKTSTQADKYTNKQAGIRTDRPTSHSRSAHSPDPTGLGERRGCGTARQALL